MDEEIESILGSLSDYLVTILCETPFALVKGGNDHEIHVADLPYRTG
jgi:hypothetical protein